MNAAKSYIVRKVSEHLAEYVDAIDPKQVETNLNFDVGGLKLENAKLNKDGAHWKQLGIRLDHKPDARRDVSLSVRIPWRVETEPWDVTVNFAKLDAQMLPRSERFQNIDPEQEWEKKRKEIRRLESVSDADPNSVSRVARIGHAVIRQIKLSAVNLEICVDREPQPQARHAKVRTTAGKRAGSNCTILYHDMEDAELAWKVRFEDGHIDWFKEDDIEEHAQAPTVCVGGLDPMIFKIGSVDLQSITDPKCSAAIEADAKYGDLAVVGNISDEDTKKMLRKSLIFKDVEIKVGENSKFCVGPVEFGAQVRHLIRSDYQELYVQIKSFDKDPEKYTFCMHSDMVKYVQSLLAWMAPPSNTVTELPSGAPKIYVDAYTKFLRKEINEDHESLIRIERVATPGWIVWYRQWCRSQHKKQEGVVEAPRSAWFPFWKRKEPSETPTAANASEVDWEELLKAAEDQLKDSMTDLDSSFKYCFLDAKVPLLKTKFESGSFGEGRPHVLVCQADEAAVAINLEQVTLQPPDGNPDASQKVKKTYKITSCTQLQSLSAMLDGCEPKVYELSLSDRPSETCPWCLNAEATQPHYDTEAWEVAINMKNAPNHMHLTPWCIHDLLEMGLAWTADLENSQPEGAREVLSLGEIAVDEQSGQLPTPEKVLGDQLLSLKFNLYLQAPIVHFILPVDGGQLEIHAGVFECTSGERAHEGDKMNSTTVQEFACKCALTDTCIKLSRPRSTDFMVLEKSEVVLDVKRSEDKFDFKTRSKDLKFRVAAQLIAALGELKLGIEYALDPLKQASRSKGASRTDATDTLPSALPRAAPEPIERGYGGKELITASLILDGCTVTWDNSTATFLSLDLNLVQKEYTNGNDGPNKTKEYGIESKTTLSKFDVQSSGVSLLECPAQAQDYDDVALPCADQVELTVSTLPLNTTVKVKLPSISASWTTDPVQSLVRSVLSAGGEFSKAERGALSLTLTPDGGAMDNGRRAWNTYMNQRTGALWQQAGQTLSQAGERFAGAILQGARPYGLEVADTGGGPSEIIEGGDGNTLTLELHIPKMSAVVKPRGKENHPAEANVRGAVVKVTKESNIKCDASIANFEISLGSEDGSRTIVRKRKRHDKLLSIDVCTNKAQKDVDINVNWAQVALTYHQHDIDTLQNLILDNVVLGVLQVIEEETKDQVSENSSMSAIPEEPGATAAPPSKIPKITYKFKIGAPLVYLSTDVNAGLCQPRKGSSLESVEGDEGECRMKTVCGDGYAMIDFGHLVVKGGVDHDGKLGPIDLKLQEVQVMTYGAASEHDTPAMHELLRPRGIRAILTKEPGIIDLKASVLSDTGTGAVQHVSITRNQVTQWMDIVFCNFNYASSSRRVDPSLKRSFSRQRSQLLEGSEARETPAPGNKIITRLDWGEPIRLDIGFTPDSMLTRAELMDGGILFCSDPTGMTVEVWCNSGSVKDIRTNGPQNVDKKFIELLEPAEDKDGSKKGFELKVQMPPNGNSDPMLVDVDLARPVLFVLPQLAMDLSIWAMAGYQQSQQGKEAQKNQEQGDTTQGPQALSAAPKQRRLPASAQHGIVKNWESDKFSDVVLWALDHQKKVAKMANGDAVEIVDFVGDEYKVVWRGQEGWVKNWHIEAKSSEVKPSTTPQISSQPLALMEPAGVRKAPCKNHLVEWMWADAGILGGWLAKSNPLRWSEPQTLQMLIADFAHRKRTEKNRPVILQFVGGSTKQHQFPSYAKAIAKMQQWMEPKVDSPSKSLAAGSASGAMGNLADFISVSPDDATGTVLDDCADESVIKVRVMVKEIGVRIAGSWKDPEKYFEFCGGLNVGVLVCGNRILLDEVKVSDGRFRRGVPNVPIGILCKKFEVDAKGQIDQSELQQGEGDAMRALRTKSVTLDQIRVGTLKVRYTVSDLMACGSALAVLLSFEADSAEPETELRQRDPLSFNATQVLNVKLPRVEIEPFQLELLDSRAHGLRPALLVTLACPALTADCQTSPGKAPRVTANLEHLEVGIRSFNERKGCWEPVLAPCNWHGSFDLRKGKEGEQMDLSLQLDTGSGVKIAVTAPFIHLIARLASMQTPAGAIQYGHMVIGTNLSGLKCTVGKHVGGRTVTIPADGVATALDDAVCAESDGDVLTDVVLWFPDLPNGSNEVEVSLAKEGSKLHKCPTLGSECALLIRVLIPHPPQRVLLISSTLLITNKTPLDVEARFVGMDPKKQDDPMKPKWEVIPCGGCHACVPVGRLHRLQDYDDRGVENVEPTSSANIHIPKHSVVAAPPCAIRGVGRAHLQVRPAPSATGGIEFSWGPVFITRDVSKAIFSTSEAEIADCRPQLLHLQEDFTRDWTDICIEAPYRIANACPCDLHIALWKPAKNNVNYLGTEKERDLCRGHTIYVKDDDGGEWEVPSKGKDVHIYPLKLDSDGWFYWYSKESTSVERTRPQWERVNYLRVTRDGNHIHWHCYQMGTRPRSSEIVEEKKLRPQEEHSLYDVPPDHMFFSVALESEDQEHRLRTEWSAGLPLMRQGKMDQDKLIQMYWAKVWKPVRLSTRRTSARRTVVFAPNWFVDATDKNIGLMQHSGDDVVRMPKFGEHGIMLPGDLTGDEPVVSLGWHRNVTQVNVPGLGSSTRVALAPERGMDFVLQTEQIAATATCGVMCTLLTVVPRLMAFCKVEGCQIGFRSHQHDPVWLSDHGSAPLYFPRHGSSDVRVELAARPLGSSEHRVQWSRTFTINESGIGVYPIVLMETQSTLRKVCVQVDQTGEFFTITANGESECHQIINRHKCYMLRAYFDGDTGDGAEFVAPYGKQVAIGRSAQSIQNTELVLELHHTDKGAALTRQQSVLRKYKLDLNHQGTKRVNRSDSHAAALISVELHSRKAHVIVTPQQIGASSNWEYNFKLTVSIPQLSVTLFGNEAQPVLAGTVQKLALQSSQYASRRRDTNFSVGQIQVDVLHPTKNVFLASHGDFLRLHTIREDLAARNMIITEATADVGNLEVYVDLDAINSLQSFARTATPRDFGLARDDVHARCGVPFNISCGGPPLPSTKYVIRDMQIGEITARAWGCVSTSNLPDIVKVLVALGSFSSYLKFDGLKVSLQRRHFPPFEGSIPALGERMRDQYKSDLYKSWKSVLVHSNIGLPLLLNPNFWNPKERKITIVKPPSFPVADGCVADVESKTEGIGAVASLDEKGYGRVVTEGNVSEMQVWVRRFSNKLQFQIVDSSAMYNFAAGLCKSAGLKQNGCDKVVEELTSENCKWAQHSTSSFKSVPSM